MDLSNLTEFLMPLVVIGCLLVGYVVKKWVKDVDNKYIPTIVALLGAVLGCVVNQGIGLEAIIYGALSGLASTGLHQAFTQMMEKKEE
ncbi:MAG: phage holin family protein [Lachnospiraceae bacterium]